ncbi:MAG: DUF4011 domain-containing protein, partial [Fimbriimonadaceae bacterium]
MHQGPTRDSVQVQIDALRRKLLDLSLRNRMLNYRPSKRIGVSIAGEESRHLFSILVEEGKKMTFVGKPEPRKDAGEAGSWLFDDDVAMEVLREEAEDELDAFLKNPAWPVDVLDTKISTEEPESILQAKLRTIAREAGLARDELGIHTLFLTLGILEWSDNGEKVYKAPLLFVPVNLERQANGTIELRYEGSDVGDNLPLRAKLAELNLKLPQYDEDKLVDSYFADVEATVRRNAGWRVLRDEVHLGFFNYEKYVMYLDLGGQQWPEGRKPWQHPEIAAMLGGGYEPVESSIDERTHLDEVRPVRDAHEVFDADSSQILAMTRVAEGHSIVVEGPPGTGKSQTITNIIAEAVASGKTVLFVAAKRAAVDVVKRNLARADLGAMCLDLHDKLTNRREFYAEIKRTVERPLSARDEEQRLTQLSTIRDQLNGHSEAVNEPLPEFGASPFQAMSILAALPKETALDRDWRIPFEKIRTLRHEDVRRMLPDIGALQNRLRTCGVPAKHPFWGAEIDYLDPAVKLDLEEDLQAAKAQLESADQAFAKASSALKVEVEATSSNAGLLRVVAVVDPSEERRDRVAALFKSEPASLPVEAINSSVADAALVASPAAFHQEQCLKLLSAGVNVLCEKPLGLSTDEVLQITKTADRFGKKCAVGLQRRFWDSCVGIEGASRAGWIGKPVRVEISAGGPFGWSAATDSFFRKETVGGGTLLDLGIHLID